MVVEAVQRERLVVQRQLDGGYADVIFRRCKAHSQRVVTLTATHAAYEVHQRGIGEVVLHGTVKIERTLRGIASAVNHSVTRTSGLHEMLADGYGQLVVTILVGLHGFAVLALQHTVHIELHAVGGHVGTSIVDVTAHDERRHIIKVGIVVYERVAVEEEQLLVGVELVNTVHGYDSIGRSFATEWYALDHIVAVAVGLGLQGQHAGRNGR